ncbi:hypothetical protein LguiB_035752 [Lonicera macranthoides]
MEKNGAVEVDGENSEDGGGDFEVLAPRDEDRHHERNSDIIRSSVENGDNSANILPDWMLINGKGPYENQSVGSYDSFTVKIRYKFVLD